MYGVEFNAMEFLLAAGHMPSRYDLWQDIPEMDDPNGMTLHFEPDPVSILPNELIRFLMANEKLLGNELYADPMIVKEVSIILENSDIEALGKSEGFMHAFTPAWLSILGRLRIFFHVSKPFQIHGKNNNV